MARSMTLSAMFGTATLMPAISAAADLLPTGVHQISGMQHVLAGHVDLDADSAISPGSTLVRQARPERGPLE